MAVGQESLRARQVRSLVSSPRVCLCCMEEGRCQSCNCQEQREIRDEMSSPSRFMPPRASWASKVTLILNRIGIDQFSP